MRACAHKDFAVAMIGYQNVEPIRPPAEKRHKEVLAMPERQYYGLLFQRLEECRLRYSADRISPADQPVVNRQQQRRERQYGLRGPELLDKTTKHNASNVLRR